jgi:hypothetical protein
LIAARRSACPKRRAAFQAFSCHRLLKVEDHDHAGLDRGAEERDVADPDGDAEVVPKPPLQQHAAGQGERHREDHVRGFRRRVKRHRQQQKDNQQHGRHDQLQRLAGADLVFILAAPLNGHARIAR